jgi:hypothetical protein
MIVRYGWLGGEPTGRNRGDRKKEEGNDDMGVNMIEVHDR